MKTALHKCIIAIFATIHVAFAQTDPCKDETQKAETLYEMCLKLNKESASYVDCIKIFVNQNEGYIS
jgi:hypothetical protein